MTDDKRLLYFDYLFDRLASGNPSIEASFGRHVHWGYWDRPEAASDADEDFARAAERLASEVCGLAGIESGDRVLDVGCGFGGTLSLLNRHHQGLHLIGLNIEERQLERARLLVLPTRDNRVSFCLGDAGRLPFANGSLDRLVAVESIFHFPSRQHFLREAFRVLRPGGVLALSDFVPSPLLVPGAALVANPRWLGRFAYFGRCNVLHTIGRYRRAAAAAGLAQLAERDITARTLPTYRYLEVLLRQRARIDGMTDVAAVAVGVLRWLAAKRLLNYYLLAFRKPDDAG